MKITKVLSAVAICACSVAALSSCSKESEQVTAKNEISADAISKIQQLGFTTKDAQKVEGGYLVEGDIMLSDDALNAKPDYKMMRVGEDEQYRTNNLVTGLPRTITIAVSSTLPSAYVTAADEAIRRYNALALRITMRRVTSGANITLTKAPSGAGYLASAGFPSGGNPYSQVLVNSTSLGTSYATTTIASVLAHEIGHCIGFRHTDYMSRQYSCGGSAVNEGASTVGAILIPGTPSGVDPNSWMLACIGSGQNRPFNTNDKTALNYLY
ncbi:M57 family metalloprotease [Hymenobacter chitinivorans]|uniref:Dual-action HEIGH metallo-peptidase n=1 Tax=Hymenobacter chitinivorans DSM 11115 TaxID=1121954 RepID=A0A2M9BA94_9BACT|nr:M57 family metalloprotease [Hymenobacter chitinivorans]PJJ54861.1 dual-action HEIGH metallo-peptidase [Hymenobacter chitinivorans DSM 11115]